MRFPGSCHCGNAAFVYETASLSLRACGCDFCRRHGARTTSDPAGRLRLFVRRPERLGRYLFGLGTAEVLLCARCGVYLGARMGDVATVNANAFDEPVTQAAEPVSYEGETAEARRARRRARWTPVTETLEGPAALGAQLLAMAELDLAVRGELAADGSLFAGYHPRMERLHLRNADRLERILEEEGWPAEATVGKEVAGAAWLIVQHAISRPDLMRRGRAAMRAAGAAPLLVAMLEDRILVLEGRPQRHGTQFDWDAEGRMSPAPVDDPVRCDERRRSLGLAPLAEETVRRRASVAESGEGAPRDLEARRREEEAWRRRVGWR